MNSRTGAVQATRTLEGLRLLVTALDLEQSEHRGIAVYSKNLLKALSQAGAEVWLLTELAPSMDDMQPISAGRRSNRLVFTARTLEGLESGWQPELYSGLRQRILNRLPLYGFSRKVRTILAKLFPKTTYRSEELQAFDLQTLYDNPYLQSERLSYLHDIKGLVCAKNIYVNSFRMAQRKRSQPITLQAKGFDAFITTAPLAIESPDTHITAQTIHDVIPLEYARTSDLVRSFTRRLAACHQSSRMFVSGATQKKYNMFILEAKQESGSRIESVVIQPPSLRFPADAHDFDASNNALIVAAEGLKSAVKLKPLRYIIFNSSIEPRKNVLFVLKAFVESGLETEGIQLCITGKLKTDSYSDAVKTLVKAHSSVILTGYVDEAFKRQLFLNAMAIVSPSLVEGFGIPVLDAACLGVPVVASLSESHWEIQQLHDFAEHVMLCSTRETSDWASALRLIHNRIQGQRQDTMADRKGQQATLTRRSSELWLRELRQQRIERYRRFQQRLEADFQNSVCELLLHSLSA
jgi:glycosyltransferase involved in cell wall biosynthesis